MTDGTDNNSKLGVLPRLWRALCRPSTRFSAGALLGAGAFAGIVLWVGFIEAVEYTDTLGYCSSCHVMQAHVLPQYVESHHYSNASGVRAVCSDCHVPNALLPKLGAKIRATVVELPAWARGTIATAERYEARKEVLARRVLARMEARDSRECRACHGWEAMASEAQAPSAWRMHQRARSEGQTCVQCHQGVAHERPAALLEPDEEIFGF